MKAVLDPNTLESAAISPRGIPAQVVRARAEGRFVMVVSPMLLDELRDVLGRPAFRHWVTTDEAVELADRLETAAKSEASGEMVGDPTEIPAVTRAADDDYLIVLARSAGADCIVSGDKDLTSLTDLQPPVLTPRAFLELIS